MQLITTLLLALGVTASPLSQHKHLARVDTPACTPASFANVTTFTLNEYKIETVTAARDNGVQGSTSLLATFSVTNPGNGDVYRLNRIPISTGGGVWSTCLPGETPLPELLKKCMYLVERRKNGRVGFRFQWLCGGGEGGKPLVFDATLVGEFPGEVCTAETGVSGVTQSCGLDAKEPKLALEVANIYWEEAP
ncbi:hypothetical protein B0T16DRAFT_462348 [Cercophora newfieldiana]|uniref:AA1-like domain-containing protein n=1 Tax=Cercophora newfieldiana TaxID=92897 RepID=A0AA39XQX9_9PEZI|nr:hypothetical protein B0T16DRAFT_462348 [Cercophora newfieldiana]